MEWQKIRRTFSLRSGGIRRRLLVWGLTLLGLALIANTLAGSIYTRRQFRKSAEELQLEMASLVARRINAFVTRKLERLSDTAVAMSLYDFGSEGQKLLALLLLKNDRSFTELTILDEKGKELVKLSERRVYLPGELSDQKASEKFTRAIGGRDYVSPVYMSDKAEPYVTLSVPLKTTPRTIVGVVSVETNLKALWDFIGQVEFSSAGYAYLVDERGRLIAHADPSLVLKRMDLSRVQAVQEFLRYPAGDPTPAGEGAGILGKPVLATYAPVADLGWAVILEEPLDVALAELRRTERYAALLLGVGLLIGAVVLVWVSKRITEPISELQRGVEVIGGGNLDHRVEIKSGDEIEQLAQEFNKMAGELKVSYAMLERRVEHRTRQLSALYDVTTIVNQSLDLEPVLEEVIKKINAIFDFDATRVFLFDSQMEELELRTSVANQAELWPKVQTFRRGQGIIGKVVEGSEAMIFQDIMTDPRYQEISHSKIAQAAGCSFFAIFPVKTKIKSIGAVVCIGKEPRRLTAEEIQLVTSMADQIGVAVEKAGLFEETVARARELSALYDVAATVTQSLEPDVLLREVVHKILEIVHFDAARIYLLNADGKELTLRVHHGISEELARKMGTIQVGVGINGNVVATGRPTIFQDIQSDPLYARHTAGHVSREAGFHSYISLPLKSSREKILGVMNFLSRRVQKLLPKDTALLFSMANQVGVALENANLFEQTAEKAKEISALYDVTATVNQSLDVPSVLQQVIEKIRDVFRFGTTRIYLLDPKTKELKLQASDPADREDMDRVRLFRLGQGIVGKVVESGEPMIFEDIKSDPRYKELSSTKNTRATGHSSLAAFPITAKFKPVGAIVCNSREPRRFTPGEIQLLTSMVGQIGVAVENANLFEQTVEKAKAISTLYDVASTVNQSLDLERILNEVTKKITAIFNFDATRVFLLDNAMNELRMQGSVGTHPTYWEKVRSLQPGRGIGGRVVEGGEALIFEDTFKDPRYQELSQSQETRQAGYGFFALFPIKTKLKTVGVISCVCKMPRRMADEEIQLITSIADQVGVAVENARLFSETKQKSLELEKANQNLHEANRAKADFLAAMSHELRTPLNVIIGNADLAKDGFFGGLTEGQEDALDKILRYSKVLLKLINDVLTLTKIEAKKMSLDLSTFDVREVIGHVQGFAEQLNRESRLDILWNVEPNLAPLTTDALKLEEILQNLIGNAYKFTPRGSITIGVRNVNGTGRIEFTVTDTGIGIQHGDLERIFDEFHQLEEAHTGNYSGVGLGLSIVKKYLNLMGGEIRVDSQPGAGTTFTFDLPYSTSDQEARVGN